MRFASLATLGLLTTVLLAGCSGGGPKADGSAGLVDDAEFEGLAPTDQTGIIRGVVVDEAVRPISGVLILLELGETDREATSADSGAFGFDGLAPGTYFLQVAKPGFQPIQVSTDVVAGVAEPPILKVQLVADPTSAPFFETYMFEGFIECSARYFIEGRNFCSLRPESTDNTLFDIAPSGVTPTFVQGELVWESTQSLGDELSFNWRRDDTSADYIDAEGPSPLLLQANQTLLEENEVGTEQPLRTIIFTAHNGATEPPCLPEVGCAWGVGVQLNQKFTVYIHVFHNMLPPEGWLFTVDGDPPVPM